MKLTAEDTAIPSQLKKLDPTGIAIHKARPLHHPLPIKPAACTLYVPASFSHNRPHMSFISLLPSTPNYVTFCPIHHTLTAIAPTRIYKKHRVNRS